MAPRAAHAILLGAALAAAPGPAAGDDAAALREDLSTLVRIAQGGIGEHDGPSPTLLAERLLKPGEAKLRPVLQEAWTLAGKKGSRAQDREVALHRVIRYLYGLDAPPAGPDKDKVSFGGTVGTVTEVEGVVVVRYGGTGERGKVYGEPGWDRDDPKTRPPFEAVVKGGRLRKPPRPAASKLLALVEQKKFEGLAEEPRASVAMAVGEACGRDSQATPRFLRLCEEDPTNPFLGAALGWCGTRESAAALRARVAPLAARVAQGREAALPLLRAACRGLARTDRAALEEEIGRLTGDERMAAMRGGGYRVSLPILLRALKEVADPAARREALARLLDLVGALQTHFPVPDQPAAADAPALVEALVSGLDPADPELRRAVLQAAYALLYWGFRDGTAGEHSSGNGVSVEGDGERCGPYPDEEAMLRRLHEDLGRGDLVLRDVEGGLFDPPVPELPGDADTPWSGIEPALPMRATASKDAPVHVAAEKTETGLRVTLRNAGRAAFCLNPVAFRYATADCIPLTVKGLPGGTRKFTDLRVQFGAVWEWRPKAVPARVLVLLEPGKTWSFDVALRADHRAVDRISVEMSSWIGVDGAPPAPLLRRLGTAWVR